MIAYHGKGEIKKQYRAHKIADDSVLIVIKNLKRRGWKSKNKGHVCANGSDLIITKGDIARTLEIKKACLSKRIWRTNPVSTKRRGDDLIAIVLPKGFVVYQSMKEHLKQCMKDGSRSVNGLVWRESNDLL